MPNVDDPRAHLLAQDVVWVWGGSVAGLLAMWRLHGVDAAMREAWEAGVVLAGVSAGSICWHVGGTTDSFGPELRPVTDGLGLLRMPTASTTTRRSSAGRCCTGWSPTAPCRPPTPRTTASACTTEVPSWSRR